MHLIEANNSVLFIKFRTVLGNFFNFILKWSNPILVISFFLFTLVIHAQSQTTNNPYWEYVRTESGTFPYPAEGCYKPTTHILKEGLVEISVKKCYNPNDKKEVRTSLRFEWDKPPSIIYPGKPFDFKISTKLIENSNPDWVIGGSIWMRPEMETDDKWPFPGWAGGISADYGKGKPQVVIIDDKQLGPPIWWGKDSKLMRLSYVVSHSDKHWWIYIYRLIEPSNSDNINSKSIPKTGNVSRSSMLAATPNKNAFLKQGEYLVSPNKKYFLLMQDDGNLVLYPGSGPENKGAAIWNTGTSAAPGTESYMAIQDDGNLVIYRGKPGDYNNHPYDSKTYRERGNYFVAVHDDGKVVIGKGSGSDTNQGIFWSKP